MKITRKKNSTFFLFCNSGYIFFSEIFVIMNLSIREKLVNPLDIYLLLIP